MKRAIAGAAVLALFTLLPGIGCQKEEKPVVIESSRAAPPPTRGDSPDTMPPRDAAAPAKAPPLSDPNAPLPPGHPPIDAGRPVTPQSGKAPPVDPNAALPAGHPPMDSAPPTAPEPVMPNAKPGTLAAAGLEFSVATDWVAEKPSSGMRLAQYKLPGKDGAAELVVFCFGPGQGGPVDANIKRWVSQFSNADKPGEPVKTETQDFEQAGLKVTIVRASGSFTPMNMAPTAGATITALPRQSLYGVIIEGAPQGNVFIKTTGPSATIEAQAAAMEKMARSVKKAG